MSSAFQINGSYGVILADSGQVIPVGPEGLIDGDDRDGLLQALLAAAVELKYLDEKLKAAAVGVQEVIDLARSQGLQAPPEG